MPISAAASWNVTVPFWPPRSRWMRAPATPAVAISARPYSIASSGSPWAFCGLVCTAEGPANTTCTPGVSTISGRYVGNTISRSPDMSLVRAGKRNQSADSGNVSHEEVRLRELDITNLDRRSGGRRRRACGGATTSLGGFEGSSDTSGFGSATGSMSSSLGAGLAGPASSAAPGSFPVSTAGRLTTGRSGSRPIHLAGRTVGGFRRWRHAGGGVAASGGPEESAGSSISSAPRYQAPPRAVFAFSQRTLPDWALPCSAAIPAWFRHWGEHPTIASAGDCGQTGPSPAGPLRKAQ